MFFQLQRFLLLPLYQVWKLRKVHNWFYLHDYNYNSSELIKHIHHGITASDTELSIWSVSICEFVGAGTS